jgi:hypothetical protein
MNTGFMLKNLVKKKQLESEGVQRLATERPVAADDADTEYSRAVSAVASCKTNLNYDESKNKNEEALKVNCSPVSIVSFL